MSIGKPDDYDRILGPSASPEEMRRRVRRSKERLARTLRRDVRIDLRLHLALCDGPFDCPLCQRARAQ